MISVFGLVYLFDALIGAWAAYRVLRFYKESKNKFAKNFGLFTLFLTISFSCFGLPSLFTFNSFILRIGYWLALLFLFISFAFLVQVPIYFGMLKFHPRWASYLLLLTGAIFLFLNIVYPNSPKIDEYGLLSWQVHPIMGIPFAIVVIFLTLWISGVFFLAGMRTTERAVKNRAFILGIVFIFAAIGGPLTHSVSERSFLIIGHIFLSMSFVLVAIALTLFPVFEKEVAAGGKNA